jgi:hypothetical protein
LGFFILGVIAYRHGWFDAFPARAGKRWLWIGLGLGVVICIMGAWAGHPLLKFGLVSLLGIPFTFGVSRLIVKLPLARRIL